jgi:hypothetical protein
MSIVYWCLHIWGDSIQAACSGNGQANFDKEFETMIDNGRETLQHGLSPHLLRVPELSTPQR